VVKARGPVTNCLLSESVSFKWTSHKSERGADYSTRNREGGFTLIEEKDTT
jgi:hypothetical protein